MSESPHIAAPAAERWERLWPYLVVAVACVAARLPFLSVPMIVDEGSYAYVAKFAGEGHRLYREIPFDRPAGIFLVYELALALLGGSVESIRLFAALWTALSGMMLFHLLQEVHSRRAAWMGALAFAFCSTTGSIEGFSANSETFMNLPLLFCALCVWRGRYGWAGFASGLAAFMKPSSVSGLLLACGCALLRPGERRGAIRATAAFSLWPIASIIHGAIIDWDAYWGIMVTERANLSVLGISLSDQFFMFLHQVGKTIPGWGVPFACSLFALLRADRRIQHFGALFIASTLAAMSIGARWDEYYFIQLVAPLCFLGGIGATMIGPPKKDLAAAAALALALIATATQELPYWLMSPTEYSEEFYHRDAYTRGQEIADFVREHTPPDEPIYVAFSNAHLYYLADRRAEPPILFWQYLSWSKEKSDRVIRTIQARTPSAIIVSQRVPMPYMNEKEFWDALNSGYEVALRARTVSVLLRRKDSAPAE